MKKSFFLLIALSFCMLHSNAQTDAKTLAYDAYNKKTGQLLKPIFNNI
jgi:hypothetical protein